MKNYIPILVCIAGLALAPICPAQLEVLVFDDFEDGTDNGEIATSSVSGSIGGSWRAGSLVEIQNSGDREGIPTPDGSDKYALVFTGTNNAYLDFASELVAGTRMRVEYEINTGTRFGPNRCYWQFGNTVFNQPHDLSGTSDFVYMDSPTTFVDSGLDYTDDRWIRVTVDHVLGTTDATITLNNLTDSNIVSTTVTDFNTSAVFDTLRFTTDGGVGGVYVLDNVRISGVLPPTPEVLVFDDFEDGTDNAFVTSSTVSGSIGGSWRDLGAPNMASVQNSGDEWGIPTPDGSGKYAKIWTGGEPALLDFTSSIGIDTHIRVEYEVNTGTTPGPVRGYWYDPSDAKINQLWNLASSPYDFQYWDGSADQDSALDMTRDRWVRVRVDHVLGTEEATITLINLDDGIIDTTTVSDFNTAELFDAMFFESDSGGIWLIDNVRISKLPQPTPEVLVFDDFEDGTDNTPVTSSTVSGSVGGSWRAGSTATVQNSGDEQGIPTHDGSGKYAKIWISVEDALLDFTSSITGTVGDTIRVEYEVNTTTTPGPVRGWWYDSSDATINQLWNLATSPYDFQYWDGSMDQDSGLDMTRDRWVRVRVDYTLGTTNARITLHNLDDSLITSTTVSDFNGFNSGVFDAMLFNSDSGGIWLIDNVRISRISNVISVPPSSTMILIR